MTPAEKLRVQKSFQSRDGKYLHREFRAKRGMKFGSLTRSRDREGAVAPSGSIVRGGARPDREGGVGRFDVTHPTAATSLLVVAAHPREGVPMAPTLPAGVRTLVNRSPRSEAGNPAQRPIPVTRSHRGNSA